MKKAMIIMLALIVCFCFFGCGQNVNDNESIVVEAPKTNEEGKFGDYLVSIEKASFFKDYDGNECILITYTFTNESEAPVCFNNAFSVTVYQNNIGLVEPYCFSGEPYDLDSPWVDIKNGATLTVEVGYILNDLESDVEVEIGEWYSSSAGTYTKIISLEEIQ